MSSVATKPIKITRRKNIHLVNKDNDIRFRGCFSYRHLRIFGWFFLIIAMVGTILGTANNMNLIHMNPTLINLIKSANALMTPLFLIAAFAQVLVAKDGYLKLIRTYSLGAIGLYALFLIIYLHFGVGTIQIIYGDFATSLKEANTLISLLAPSGTFSFNIFIDLLLCALVTFFLNYHPTKHFQGKKIYIFRLLVLIPILYDLTSITFRLLASEGLVSVNPFFFPLLTTKPPVAFLVFIVLALFVKNREKFYVKHGKTHEEYKEFLNTNVNRFHFAKFLAFTIIASVIIDIFLAGIVFAIKVALLPEGIPEEYMETVIFSQLQSTYDLGFGKCVPMIFLLPIIFFFDYTKTYKNKNIDLIIPVAGVAIIALVFIEGFYQILKGFGSDMIRKMSEGGGEDSESGMIGQMSLYLKAKFSK